MVRPSSWEKDGTGDVFPEKCSACPQLDERSDHWQGPAVSNRSANLPAREVPPLCALPPSLCSGQLLLKYRNRDWDFKTWEMSYPPEFEYIWLSMLSSTHGPLRVILSHTAASHDKQKDPSNKMARGSLQSSSISYFGFVQNLRLAATSMTLQRAAMQQHR